MKEKKAKSIVKFTVRAPELLAAKLRSRVYKRKNKDRTYSENKFILEAIEEKLVKEDGK